MIVKIGIDREEWVKFVRECVNRDTSPTDMVQDFIRASLNVPGTSIRLHWPWISHEFKKFDQRDRHVVMLRRVIMAHKELKRLIKNGGKNAKD